MPETSIVIRTYNEEKHIRNLLEAIERQNYKNYEIIIVDSGSTDNTLDIAKKFNNVKVLEIETKDFTFGYSLNVGCGHGVGKYIVCVSAHIIPTDNEWLFNLISPLKDSKIAMVYGRQIGIEQSKFSEKRDFEKFFHTKTKSYSLPIYYANNANSVIRKDLWRKKQFDEYLFGLEDIAWAKYMTENGHIVYYEPKAIVHHIHQEEWHQIFNRYRREAISAVRIGLKHPPQARIDITGLFFNLLLDILSSFPNYSYKRLDEIIRFRYFQWKGSRTGWRQGKNLDIETDKNSVFRPSENKTVVIKHKHKAETEEMPVPELKPGDILIKVGYVGVCHTDIEIYEGTLGYYRSGIANYPIIPGHEFSGTIVQVGANNKFQERFKIGQKVVGECILSKGEKSERREIGVVNYNGAYSRYVIVPGDYVHKIPDEMDLKTAALTEPLSVVIHGLERIKHILNQESTIAVIGAGPIGNFCSQVLSLEGHKIHVFDKTEERLELLKEKVYKNSTKLADFEKFDIIVEATGSKQVLEQILKESRVNSTILLLGFPYGEINFDFEDLVAREKNIIGSVGAGWEDFKKALRILPKLDTEQFTRHVLPLEDFKKAWELQRASKHLKILLKL